MSNRVWPVDAVSGAPEYSGRALRQTQMAPLLPAATTARPLGTRSGVRPGTSPTTVTATTTTWTCRPHAGILDVLPAAEAGPYGYAIDADATGSMTPPNATNPRRDILFVQLTDPAESTGGTVPGVVLDYAAGSPAASPTAPAAPARSLVLAEINVPAVGGGNPAVTWVAPVLQSGIWPVRNVTERAALASAIGASTLNPLYVHRADADDIGRLEVTENGTAWRTVFSEVGRGYASDGSGGGALTTSWATSSAPAAIELPPGRYIVHASIGLTLSTSANVGVEAHLFDSTGSPFGSAQGTSENRWANGVAGVASTTLEFTRLITVPSGGRTVQIRRRTSATGGTQSSSIEHLVAQRVG